MKQRMVIFIVVIAVVLAALGLYSYAGAGNGPLRGLWPLTSARFLDAEVVNVLRGETPGDIRQAEQQVVAFLLADAGLTGWLKQGAPVHRMVSGDVHPAPGPELLVAVSLGKDRGVVGVLARETKGYKMVGMLADLVPVTGLSSTGLPGLPYRALVVDQYLDEMVGGFFEVGTRALFVFRGRTWKKAWERATYLREYHPEGGEIVGAQARWLLREERAEVVFRPDGRIVVNGEKRQGSSRSPGLLSGDYTITGTEPISELYRWDSKKKVFTPEHSVDP